MAMLLVGLGSAAASSVAEPVVDLVLAVKEGDSVAWAQKYAGRARVIAYNKGQQALGLSSVSEVALPNVGREAHAYLHHIVHRFDSLAEKTVFMPGGLPTAGFHGFAQSGGSLLPGATLEDYLSSDAAELMVPTMALSKDLKQFSVRMSLMDNKTETNVEGGKRFGVCSADGSAGWSPFLPNKFASSVLEPLMTQQHAQWDFPSFWARYMPTTPLPERVLAAHGAVFSVSRENIRSHPKHFYEGLLKELEGTKDPYQSFFLEHMWWYVFHSATAAPCEADFAPEGAAAVAVAGGVATRTAASRKLERRKLANVYTLVSPHAGQQVDFGSTINVQWSVNNDGYQRVELWRYGSFVTRIYNSKYGYANTVKEVNWHVEPGPQADSSDFPSSSPDKTYGALKAGGQIAPGTKAWLQFFKNFQPGDKYTVRVCGYSENEDEEICDDTYGESGEFNINAVVRMLSPVQANTYTPGDFIPITWQSYFVSGNKVNIKIKYQSNVVWSKDAVDDTGAYTFYVPPDMKAGLYTIEVVGMQPTPAPCADSTTYADPFGFNCFSWSTAVAATATAPASTSCKAASITSCGSWPAVVITTPAVAAVPAVVAVVGVTAVAGVAAVVAANGTILTPAVTAVVGVAAVNASAAVAAVAAVTTGGNPFTAYGIAGLGADGFGISQMAVGPGLAAAPSPGLDGGGGQAIGVKCTVGDLFAQDHFWGSNGVKGATAGTWASAPTRGNDNANAIRAACPLACGTCPQDFSSPYVGSCQSSTCQTTFTMGSVAPPPAPAGGTHSTPTQWEVPIIQAFKGSYGLDEIKHGPGPYGTTISSTSTVLGGGTHPGGLNCDYVCHVYEQSNGVVGGRRLLFGGLQTFSQVDTNTFVGCSQDMRDCGCCTDRGSLPTPFVPGMPVG